MNRLSLILLLAVFVGCNKEPPAEAAAPAAPKIDVGSLPPPPSGAISGRIELAPSMADKVAAGDAIYLVARNAATGQPVAVARLDAPAKFPLAFELSGSHSGDPSAGLFGKVKLTARVDKDGDAMTKNLGDVVGEVAALVEVPKSDVVLTLDKVLDAESATAPAAPAPGKPHP